MGRRNLNVVFVSKKKILSADNSKSRRCLEHTLKVVVAIYIVEYKIGVFLHYLGHFSTRNNEI
jgi:hypothetical protein